MILLATRYARNFALQELIMSRVPRSVLPAWNSKIALGSMQTFRTARNIVHADWQCPLILNSLPERSTWRKILGANSLVMPLCSQGSQKPTFPARPEPAADCISTARTQPRPQ